MTSRTTTKKTADTIADECFSMRTRFLNRTINSIYDEAFRELGVTASQANMLVAIVKVEDLSPTQLSQILNIEKSTLSRNLDRLRKAELIEIVEPNSGRTKSLKISQAGNDLMPKMYPLWQKAQESVQQLLGEQGSADLKASADSAREKLTI